MGTLWFWLCAASSVPAETLRTGMAGDAVIRLQQQLSEAGYFARAADGEYGSATAKAVSLFQKDHGLRVTGTADEKTVKAVGKAQGSRRKGGGILMAEGNRGNDVKTSQELLAVGGFLKGEADGIYGKETASAVSAYQKARKLPVSGMIDEATLEMLRTGSTSEAARDTDEGKEDLRSIQKKLQAAGYPVGEADGLWGGKTADGIKAFQRDRGLSVTGKLDKKTKKELRSFSSQHADIRKGDTGERVVRLQNLLTLHGFSDGASDGIFGNSTEESLKQFQKFHGLQETGTADARIWTALGMAPAFQGQYKKMYRMHSTAYTPYDSGGSGHTALGYRAGKGHAAVDPQLIPLGSLLFIEGYGYAVADDIGGSIQGETVDVGVDTLDQAYQWGARQVNVYVIR